MRTSHILQHGLIAQSTASILHIKGSFIGLIFLEDNKFGLLTLCFPTFAALGSNINGTAVGQIFHQGITTPQSTCTLHIPADRYIEAISVIIHPAVAVCIGYKGAVCHCDIVIIQHLELTNVVLPIECILRLLIIVTGIEQMVGIILLVMEDRYHHSEAIAPRRRSQNPSVLMGLALISSAVVMVCSREIAGMSRVIGPSRLLSRRISHDHFRFRSGHLG